MTDDVIERVAKALDLKNLNWDNDFPHGVWKTECMKQAHLALSALKPGDVLPNGCVVVPDNDWAVVAQFSALSLLKKRAVFAFIEAAKEEG